MTEVRGGYRTLAQLGAASPRLQTPYAGPQWFVPAVPVPPELPPEAPNDTSTTIDGREPGIWNVPFTPLTVPTPTRMAREGVELVRDYHPRDPEMRMTGTFIDAPKQPEGEDEDEPRAPSQADGTRRSDAAKAAMWVGIGGGFTQNAIDVVRLVKKYPEALRAGRFDPSLGRLGRLPTALGLTALTRPDNRIIDPRFRGLAASLETGGRTFDRFDDIAMKTSVLLGASLAAIQIGSSIPNLADALSKDGPWYENLAQSTSGRAGVLQLTGGTIGAAVFLTALKQTAGQGTGVVGRITAAGGARINTWPIWGRIAVGGVLLVASNELGFLDWLNKGETRGVGQVLTDSAHKTPVLNDPAWRTAAILGGGAMVGFKAHRAIAAAGGMSGLRAGHWIAGAAIAGMLGAQLLGGLSGLNKPDKPAKDAPD